MSAAAPFEIRNTSEWNNSLRKATSTGETILVDFHATWCGPCKVIAPKYKALAAENPQARFLRVDVDKQQAIAKKYQISAMPTFLVIKQGKVVESLQGADPAGLTRMVKGHAGPNPPIPPLAAAAEEAKEAGNAAFKARAFADAISKYSEAITISPESSLLYTNRSLAYLKNKQTEEAVSDARKAVDLEPRGGKGWVRLGDGLVKSDNPTEAGSAYRKALELLSEGLMRTEVQQKLDQLTRA